MGFGSRKRTPWSERPVENMRRALRKRVLRVLSMNDLMSPAQIIDAAGFGPVSPLPFLNEMMDEGLIENPEPWACIGFGGGWRITKAGRDAFNQQETSK